MCGSAVYSARQPPGCRANGSSRGWSRASEKHRRRSELASPGWGGPCFNSADGSDAARRRTSWL